MKRLEQFVRTWILKVILLARFDTARVKNKPEFTRKNYIFLILTKFKNIVYNVFILEFTVQVHI